jgi:hypothetical protein
MHERNRRRDFVTLFLVNCVTVNGYSKAKTIVLYPKRAVSFIRGACANNSCPCFRRNLYSSVQFPEAIRAPRVRRPRCGDSVTSRCRTGDIAICQTDRAPKLVLQSTVRNLGAQASDVLWMARGPKNNVGKTLGQLKCSHQTRKPFPRTAQTVRLGVDQVWQRAGYSSAASLIPMVQSSTKKTYD